MHDSQFATTITRDNRQKERETKIRNVTFPFMLLTILGVS